MNRITTNLPLFGDPRMNMMMFTLAVCSGYFTYRGAALAITAGEAGWVGHTGALIFAIASSTSIFLLWTAAPLAVVKQETPRARIAGLGLTAVASVMIGSLSSWLNVAGIAGDSAISFHMERSISEFEPALDRRNAGALSIKSFQLDLKAAYAAFVTRQKSEFENGAYTGRAGPGTVEQLLGTLAGQLKTLDEAIDVELVRMAAVAANARSVLTTMRAVTRRGGDTAARMEALAQEADRLRSVLGELDAAGLIRGLQRSLQSMPGEVALQAVSGRTPKAAEDQRRALQRIEAELTDVIGRLDRDLELRAEGASAPLPALERINAIEAVWRYPLQHAPYWAGGIALDFTPTLLLLYAMLICHTRGRRGLFIDDAANLTVRELKTAQHGLDLLRESRIDRKAIDHIHNALTGTEDSHVDPD